MTLEALMAQFSPGVQEVLKELRFAWEARGGTVQAGDKEVLFKRGRNTMLGAWRSKRPNGHFLGEPFYPEWLVFTRYAALTQAAIARLESAGMGFRRIPDERAEYHWVVPLFSHVAKHISLIVDAAWGE